jgi:hypothetical protein
MIAHGDPESRIRRRCRLRSDQQASGEFLVALPERGDGSDGHRVGCFAECQKVYPTLGLRRMGGQRRTQGGTRRSRGDGCPIEVRQQRRALFARCEYGHGAPDVEGVGGRSMAADSNSRESPELSLSSCLQR